MRVYLDFLGCRLNEAELQSWADQFSAQGLTVINEASTADLIVLNSCAVTTAASRKSRQNIRRLHKQSANARLVVTGCYASLETEQVAAILGVDLVLDNSQKSHLVKRVVDELSIPTQPQQATEPGGSAFFSRHRTRAFVKIQDGCRYRCSYCIVTVARGKEQSRRVKDVVDEVNRLHLNGIREVVLTGVHVGGYGSDIGSSLHQLVEAILSHSSIPRIRFASVEPWDLSEKFLTLFENPRLMAHMHLPMQSGSDSVLRRMSRRCKTKEFSDLVKNIKTKIPHFNITTDIIVGFPGETEEEWQQTLEFVENQEFGGVHIFSFSPREGTKAATLDGAVSAEIKKSRSKQLHKLAAQHKKRQLEIQLGTISQLLLESDFDELGDGCYRYWGHTPEYIKVSMISANKNLSGSIVEATLKQVNVAGVFIEAEFNKIILEASSRASIPVLQAFV